MIRAIFPLLLCLALVAEEAPRLDPSKPADALAIVTQVCARAQMTVADAQAVIIALQTLNAAVAPKPARSIAPVEPPKDKP